MGKRTIKAVSFLLAVLLITALFAGCGKKGEESKSGQNNNNSTSSNGNTYPLKTNVTLKFWEGLSTNVSPAAKSLGDTPFAKELEKKTGVKVEYIHPAQGQEKEQFNLLLASGDMPDIIAYDWYNFPGGPEKAINDGYIANLNEIIEKWAPNLKKRLKSNAEWDKMVKTDSGNYYVFPFIRGDDYLMVFRGPIVRKDWLDELGLQVPATIDEWYTVLKAFKEKKNLPAPLTFIHTSGDKALSTGAFIGAYGVNLGWYVDDGKINYGQMQPGYKDFLITMRKWYQEGLLDKNIANVDGKTMDANVTGDKSGATIGYTGSSIGKYTSAMREKNPKVTLVGAPYPTLKKGETPKFGQRDLPYTPGGSAAISNSSKNKEIAAKWLDYGYGEEGHMLFNFGIEGQSYKMENGYPKYTELITNNPQKLSMTVAIAQYARSCYNGPFVQDKRYLEQYLQLPEQKEAVSTWMKTDAAKHLLPRITPTPTESQEMAKIMNEVNTYVDEMFLKFIMGSEPIDNFDKYVDQIKKLGIEKAISIQQTALDRYNKR